MMRNVENLCRGLQLMCRGNAHTQTHRQTERQRERQGERELLRRRCVSKMRWAMSVTWHGESNIVLSNDMPALAQSSSCFYLAVTVLGRSTSVELYLFHMRPVPSRAAPRQNTSETTRINTSEIHKSHQALVTVSCPYTIYYSSLHWKWHYESAILRNGPSQIDDSLECNMCGRTMHCERLHSTAFSTCF